MIIALNCNINFETILVLHAFLSWIDCFNLDGRPQGIFLCLESLWVAMWVELPPGMLRTVE